MSHTKNPKPKTPTDNLISALEVLVQRCEVPDAGVKRNRVSEHRALTEAIERIRAAEKTISDIRKTVESNFLSASDRVGMVREKLKNKP